MTRSRLADEFDRLGFVVVSGVFPPGEVAELRDTVGDVLEERRIPFGLGEVLPNAAVEAPAVAHLFHHTAVLAAVREVLDVAKPVFTMEAGVHRNVTGPWHKDLGEHVIRGGYYGCADPCSRDDCRVLKVAVYLQDHVAGTGLTVRPGSHRMADLTRGEEVALRTRAGDVVLFDARLTHRGAAPTRGDRLIAAGARALPRAVRQQEIARARRRMNRLQGRPDRLAVFFAFGPPGPRTEAYGRRNLQREQQQTGNSETTLAPQLLDAFRKSDVEILDV
jgi:hypothetical protein